jgi:hypothetical protein
MVIAEFLPVGAAVAKGACGSTGLTRDNKFVTGEQRDILRAQKDGSRIDGALLATFWATIDPNLAYSVQHYPRNGNGADVLGT